MTRDEAYAASRITIGAKYRFDYPTEFVMYPDHSEHRGQTVEVLRPCTEEEAEVRWDDLCDGRGDRIIDRMFRVRATDGWEGYAWETELAPG